MSMNCARGMEQVARAARAHIGTCLRVCSDRLAVALEIQQSRSRLSLPQVQRSATRERAGCTATFYLK